MKKPSDVKDAAHIDSELEAAYRQMAEDEHREAEALEWAEAMIGDVLEVQLGLTPW